MKWNGNEMKWSELIWKWNYINEMNETNEMNEVKAVNEASEYGWNR